MGRLIELAKQSWHDADSGQAVPETDAAAGDAGALDFDFPIVITAMPINVVQRRIALAVVVSLLLVSVATAPLSNLPTARIDTFVPVLQAVLCLVNLITAALLFSQYLVRPLLATLVIAAGYVVGGLLAFAQTLAFPGAYSPTGVIGNGWNTAAWLFVLWHTAFPLAALTYALLKDRMVSPSHRAGSPIAAIVVTIVGAVAATAVLTYTASALSGFLPSLYEGAARQAKWTDSAKIYLWLLNNLALAVLFFRRRTILDLWLTVTLFAWWPSFLTINFLTVIPFSIGWYLSRCFAVVASSALLLVLLAEMTMIYARLANSILLLRRERTERLASVEAATAAMAHEIRQPLAGIESLSAAGQRWLDRTPANVEKAKSCLASIRDATRRSEEIITSVRGLFKNTPGHRAMVQLNEVSRLVMRLVRHDLLSSAIFVTMDYQENLPPIYADHIQLQQVILNLVKNSIDAMSGRPFGKRRLHVATGSDGHSVVSFYIRDSGPGVAAENRDRIFQPFFTTKSKGMGLGLSICRRIVVEHGGALRLTKSSPSGSTFEIALPVALSQSVDYEQMGRTNYQDAPSLVPGE
jgi:signal transduction histidine kinase